MKAVVYDRYGSPDVLQLREVPKPSPRDDEVLIKVHATTVTSADWRARSLRLPSGFGLLGRVVFGLTKPRQPILGTELSGEIEAVGRAVRGFNVGDPVFAFTGGRMGCHAEYKCVAETAQLARKPDNLTYDEAAALSFGGMASLAFLRKARIQKGESVLVNGASGGVGTAAVQIARHFGARVTGVCSGANVEMVRSLGADSVIDYTTEDFTRTGDTYDVILDTAGTAPFSRVKGSLKSGGRLLVVLGTLTDLLTSPWLTLTSGMTVVAGPQSPRSGDIGVLAALAESGALKVVIDRRFPFTQIADAHRLVDTGHKKGSVVITVAESSVSASPVRDDDRTSRESP